MGDRLPVTVVVPVKNEELSLAECLASVAWAEQIVVVDSHSSDRTGEIVEQAGATLLQFDWNGGYPKKRNWVLQTYAFSTEWVLFLDADERLTPAFVSELRAAISNEDYAGYWLRYRIHFMGKVLNHGLPQRKLTLFRVGAGYFEQIDEERWSSLDMETHEHPILEGRVGEIGARIEHADYRGLENFIARHNAYSSWEARRFLALQEDGEKWRALTPRQKAKYKAVSRWWFPYAYFFYTYIFRLGFLDGRAGFVYAAFKLMYFFQTRQKILEFRKKATS